MVRAQAISQQKLLEQMAMILNNIAVSGHVMKEDVTGLVTGCLAHRLYGYVW